MCRVRPVGRRDGELVTAVVAFALRFALAIVLAVAAVAKARSFGAFERTVDAVLPWGRAARPAAAAVIVVEALLAVLLATGLWLNAVALATLALFLAFAAVSLWAARRGLHVRCNCFGQSERELGKDSLVTSLVLAGGTVAYWALARQTDESLTLGKLPLAVVLGAAVVLAGRWALTSSDLVKLIRQRKTLESDLAKAGGPPR
jgi:uncharacterized membrane protein YphA (DoxX/SURF4 family)